MPLTLEEIANPLFLVILGLFFASGIPAIVSYMVTQWAFVDFLAKIGGILIFIGGGWYIWNKVKD